MKLFSDKLFSEMLISCYKRVKFRKAELVNYLNRVFILKIMTYVLMNPMERP